MVGPVSLPKSLGGWTFVRNGGTAAEAVVGAGEQVAVPFERLQASGLDVKSLVSLFNRFVDNVIRATRGARSYPFGAAGTVFQAVSFVSGKPIKLAHRLGTASLSAIFSVTTTPGTVPDAYVAFDANYATFTPSTSWVGDVYILVMP
jgi:hypothetical protein